MNRNLFDVLLGLQWGDEGKGKVVDKLTSLREYNTVARFQGGPNAGHTVYYETFKHNGDRREPPTAITEKIVIRQVPSGILTDGTMNIIGNGCVIDPIVLNDEIERLLTFKSDVVERLYIDYDAVIITPIHRYIDSVQEDTKKAANDNTFIGTTKRGIGPSYTDKISRDAFHIYDLMDFDKFKEAYKAKLELFHNYDEDIFKVVTEEENERFLNACAMIAHGTYKIHSSVYLNDTCDDHRVLCEGAQGTMLDIDHGSFPFVTSSNTTIGAVCTGLGIGPNKINNVFGLFKAYCTRVGTGPFPTEDATETGGKVMQEKGAEFGAVTGRPRRCGWLDLVQLRHACEINGVTSLIMTKADILSGMDMVKVCVGYQEYDDNGKLNPVHYGDIRWYDLDRYIPEYKVFSGWLDVYELDKNGRTENISYDFDKYVEFIEKYLHLPIGMISFGPGKEDIMYRNGIFNLEEYKGNVAEKEMDKTEQQFMEETIKRMNGNSYEFTKQETKTENPITGKTVYGKFNDDWKNMMEDLNSMDKSELDKLDPMFLASIGRLVKDTEGFPKHFLHPEVEKDCGLTALENACGFTALNEKELQQEMIDSLPHTKNLIVPEHYGAGKIQCIEMMLQTFGKQSTMDFCKLNAFKYLWRSTHKGKEFQDMDKASKYMEYWRVLNDLPGEADDGSFKAFLNNPSNK